MNHESQQLNNTLRCQFINGAPYLILIGITVAVFRGVFLGSPGSIPQGTNVANGLLVAWFRSLHPFSLWFNITDWGQPVQGYPGVTILGLAEFALPPSLLISAVEFTSFLIAGVTTYFVLRYRLQTPPLAATVAATYYCLLSEIPQLYEGHTSAMISLAVAPIFVFYTYSFVTNPGVLEGGVATLSLWVLYSMGDLGILYMLLFFVGIMAIVGIILTVFDRGYSCKHLWPVVGILAINIALLGPLLVTASHAGSGTQLTTNINQLVIPFSQVSGQPLAYAVSGYVADNSFIFFTWGKYSYAAAFEQFLPLYLVVPTIVSAYVLLARSLRKGLFLLSAGIAIVFSTGPIVPGLATFNSLFYSRFPLFHSIPAMFRWNVWTILVFSILLGLALGQLERWGWIGLSRLNCVTTNNGSSSAQEFTRTPLMGGPTAIINEIKFRRWVRVRDRHRKFVRASVATLIIIVMLAPVTQNGLAFASPIGSFQYPNNYVAGVGFITNQEAGGGGVLAIPFGGIYERTPWGGVSGSSVLTELPQSGRNTVIFEAGTPYALEMDNFIGNGLTFGLSNNVTKFLAASNVEYVLTTNYTNWSYVSDPVYDPQVSYETFHYQAGITNPVFSGKLQTVYYLQNFSTLVSFSKEYYVYSGGNSLLYDILNSPWYTGAATPLVNLSDIPYNTQEAVLVNSSGLIVDPLTLPSVPLTLIQDASRRGIPIIDVISGLNLIGNTGTIISSLWKAGNGISVAQANPLQEVQLNSGLAVLSQSGFSSATIGGRILCSPGADLELTLGPRSNYYYSPNPLSTTTAVNFTNLSIVSAGINNQGRYSYNGSVQDGSFNGKPALLWNFTAGNSTYQYLNFNIHDLAGVDGFSIQLAAPGSEPLSLLAQILYNGTGVSIPGYQGYSDSLNQSTYNFYFPGSLSSGLMSHLAHNLTSVNRFVIGLPVTPENLSSLVVTNLLTFNSSQPSFESETLGTVGIPTFGTTVTANSHSACAVDTITVRASADQSSPRSVVPSITGPLDSKMTIDSETPDRVSFSSNVSGCGILQFAETFSQYWNLGNNRVPSVHFPYNIGLNGYFTCILPGEVYTIVYQPAEVLAFGIVAEVGGLAAGPVWFLCSWLRLRRRRLARLRPVAPE